MRRQKATCPWIAGLLLASAPIAALAAAGLTPAEARGRSLYLTGAIEGDAAIGALLGAERIEVPAAAVPCARCHGEDGSGRRASGEAAPDLRRARLAGRRHDARRLTRAVTMGIGAAGEPLEPRMPRYRLSHRQAADLIAYLERLGASQVPGVRDDAIAIGTKLPPPGDVRAAVEGVLRAHFAEVNDAGGIHGRRLELRLLGVSPASGAALDAGGVFAMTSVFAGAAPPAVSRRIRAQGIPTVGTLGDDAARRDGNPFVFRPYAGLGAQARALALFVARGRSTLGEGLVVLHADDAHGRELLEVARAAWGGGGGLRHDARAIPDTGFDADALAAVLAAAGARTVLALTPGEATAALARAARARSWAPVLLSPAGLLADSREGLPRDWPARVYVAYTTLPADWSPAGLAAYRRLAERFDLPPRQRALQLAVLANAGLLVEGLRRAGRDLTRARLVQVLEGLRDHRTGLGPTVTFGPGRREGSRGAWVISSRELSGRVAPAPVWVR